MPTEIRVPTLGESVTEATVARWLKQPGEAVARDEPVVELETDKVTLEVPAPAAGTLGEIHAAEGANVPVGAVLATIADGAIFHHQPLSPLRQFCGGWRVTAEGWRRAREFPARLRTRRPQTVAESGVEVAA